MMGSASRDHHSMPHTDIGDVSFCRRRRQIAGVGAFRHFVRHCFDIRDAISRGRGCRQGQLPRPRIFAGGRNPLPGTPPLMADYARLAIEPAPALSGGCSRHLLRPLGRHARKLSDTTFSQQRSHGRNHYRAHRCGDFAQHSRKDATNPSADTAKRRGRSSAEVPDRRRFQNKQKAGALSLRPFLPQGPDQI